MLILSVLIAGGLFIERYGVNLVQYHSLQPDCAKIESLDQCLQYGPWARNYTINATNQASGEVPLDPSQALFLPDWVSGMVRRLYFAINYDYLNYDAPPVLIYLVAVIGAIGSILFVIFHRALFRGNHQLALIALVTLIYVASLLYVNYTDYLKFKTMLAINGRYLILILPFVFAFLALAYSACISRLAARHASIYKVGLTVVALLLTLQGGGILTYIVRSDTNWYWDNQTVISINTTAKKLVTPFILGADHKVPGV